MGGSWCKSKRNSHEYRKRVADLDAKLKILKEKSNELDGHVTRLGGMSGDNDGTNVSPALKEVIRLKKLVDASHTKAFNALVRAQATQGVGSILSETMSSAQKVQAIQGKETTEFDKFVGILEEHTDELEENAHFMDELENAMAESEKRISGETEVEDDEEVMVAPTTSVKIASAPRVPVKAPSVHHDETDDLLQVAGMV